VIVGLALVLLVVGFLFLEGQGDPVAGASNVFADVRDALNGDEQTRFDELQPDVQTQLSALLTDLKSQGIDAYVGQTLRTQDEEASVIAAGRSAVTTHSWHELGRAVDLYPRDPITGAGDHTGTNLDAIRTIALTAQGRGWRQLGFNDDGSKRTITTSSGKKIWDSGHIEWRSPYGSIAEAVAAEGSNYGIA
jgi:hypothetical protein